MLYSLSFSPFHSFGLHSQDTNLEEIMSRTRLFDCKNQTINLIKDKVDEGMREREKKGWNYFGS